MRLAARDGALIAAAAIVLWPVLVTAMPPVLDYPNHLVRFWLLSGHIAAMSRFFAVDWTHTVTNVAMDMLAAVLGRIVPAPVAGRIILGLAAVLPPLGSVLLSRAMFGRTNFWHALTFLTAWSLVLLTGFMSLELSYGVALLLATWRKEMRGGPVRQTGLRIMDAVLIGLVHPFGILLYAAVAAGLILGPAVDVRSPAFWRDPWRPGLSLLAGLLIAGLVFLGLTHLTSGDEGGGLPPPIWEGGFFDQFGLERLGEMLLSPFRSYRLWPDLVFAVIFIAPVAVFAGLKRLSVHWGLLICAAAVVVVALMSPQDLGSTSLVDYRLMAMAALILPAAVLPELPDDRRWQVAAYGVALAVVAARVGWLGAVWEARQADVASLQRAVAQIPAGARVLPLTAPGDPDTEPEGRYLSDLTATYNHLPTLIVIWRQAYVPTVFAQPGKQPLSVLPPYDDTHEVSGGLPATPDDLRRQNGDVDGFLPGWPAHFDYIVMVNADRPGATRQLPGACLADDEGYAVVWRVGPCLAHK